MARHVRHNSLHKSTARIKHNGEEEVDETEEEAKDDRDGDQDAKTVIFAELSNIYTFCALPYRSKLKFYKM